MCYDEWKGKATSLTQGKQQLVTVTFNSCLASVFQGLVMELGGACVGHRVSLAYLSVLQFPFFWFFFYLVRNEIWWTMEELGGWGMG